MSDNDNCTALSGYQTIILKGANKFAKWELSVASTLLGKKFSFPPNPKHTSHTCILYILVLAHVSVSLVGFRIRSLLDLPYLQPHFQSVPLRPRLRGQESILSWDVRTGDHSPSLGPLSQLSPYHEKHCCVASTKITATSDKRTTVGPEQKTRNPVQLILLLPLISHRGPCGPFPRKCRG